MSRREQYSLPLINTDRRSKGSSLGKSMDENNPENSIISKLPTTRMTTVLRKIGAGDRKRQMYVPNEEDQTEFKRRRLEELTREYSPQRYIVKQPYRGDIDEIVMDCYTYGQNTGRKTVWRKYRQHCDQLSFDTWRLLYKKK